MRMCNAKATLEVLLGSRHSHLLSTALTRWRLSVINFEAESSLTRHEVTQNAMLLVAMEREMLTAQARSAAPL